MTAKTIHTFIISWPGRHAEAAAVARALAFTCRENLTVVYSHPEEGEQPHFPCLAVRRPNDLFWADKFQACLEVCRADIMLVIHADGVTDDWVRLVSRCRAAMEANDAIGVWAPLIDGTVHDIAFTEVGRLPGTDFSLVTQTDGIVFALSRPVMKRMRRVNFAGNLHGWGIDSLFNCHAASIGKASVVDRGVAVTHPVGSGYARAEAMDGYRKFLREQLSDAEWTLFQYTAMIANLRRRQARPA